MTRQVTNRIYPIEQVRAGMVLGKTVYTEDGKIAISEGTVLNESVICKLKLWGFDSLAIAETLLESKTAVVPQTEQYFFEEYERTVCSVRSAFEAMRYSKTLPIKDFQDLASEAIEPMLETVGIINHLYIIKRQDDYTFHHSLNVSLIAGVMGKWLGYGGNELKKLILTGLMHDIGKANIPLDILNKPAKLTVEEMEIMKLHSIYGYNMVKKIDYLPQEIKIGVLQHHERVDGTGYPLGVRGEKIHPFAKIIAVVDVYDALTSDRVYHRKVSPFSVVETINQEMFKKLDPYICSVFLNNVRDYFIGNIVKLSDGREAEVVYLVSMLLQDRL